MCVGTGKDRQHLWLLCSDGVTLRGVRHTVPVFGLHKYVLLGSSWSLMPSWDLLTMARVFLENCQRTVRWKMKFEVFVAFTILLNYDVMVFDFCGGTSTMKMKMMMRRTLVPSLRWHGTVTEKTGIWIRRALSIWTGYRCGARGAGSAGSAGCVQKKEVGGRFQLPDCVACT